jgi:hypothetical membrane protein
MATDRRRRAGAACWIATTLVFAAGNVAAQLAWKTPYSLRHNNISDLGAVHCGYTDPADDPPVRYLCSPLHAVFNVSAALTGVLVLAGLLLTAPWWGRGFGSATARTMVGLGACGYLVVALAPSDVNLGVHVLGALLVIGVADLGLLVAGLAFGRGPLRSLRTPTLVIAGLALAGAVLHFARHYAGLGMGGTERVAVFAPEVWLTLVAARLLRAPTGG